MRDGLQDTEEVLNDLARSASAGTAAISYRDSAGKTVTLSSEIAAVIANRATRRRREFTEDDEARTTSFGLYRYGKEYGQAAHLVAKKFKGLGSRSAVAAMLIGHSIELSLKAYLRSRGMTLSELNRIGHDLSKAYKKAKRLRIDRFVDLPPEYVEAIRLYGKHHKSGGFRYIRNGTITLPSWTDMTTIAQLLTMSLRDHCLRKTFGRQKAKELIANRGDDL